MLLGDDGEHWTCSSSAQRIDDILDRWIERKFSRNGKGSPFPLKKPKKDQRKVELWYQMQGYICENYPLYYEERM